MYIICMLFKVYAFVIGDGLLFLYVLKSFRQKTTYILVNIPKARITYSANSNKHNEFKV